MCTTRTVGHLSGPGARPSALGLRPTAMRSSVTMSSSNPGLLLADMLFPRATGSVRPPPPPRHRLYLHLPVNPFKAQWIICVPPAFKIENSTLCPQSVFHMILCTTIVCLKSIDWLEAQYVFCEVLD